MSGDWRVNAACRDVDPELFFPTATTGPAHDQQVRLAKAVCSGCPVVEECLSDALVRIPCGVAGGLTEQERRALRRYKQRQGGTTRRLDQVGDAACSGRRLLEKGWSPRAAADRCGVSVRTAERWAAAVRRDAVDGAEAAS